MPLELRDYNTDVVRAMVDVGLDIEPFIYGQSLDEMKVADIGPCGSLWLDGEPLAAIGLTPVWDGVAEAWMMVAPVRFEKHWLPVVRYTLRKLHEYRVELELHRVQATVLTNFAAARCFIEWKPLGFKFEGEMRGYFPSGADALRYAWVA